jgi:hypothetical protein
MAINFFAKDITSRKSPGPTKVRRTRGFTSPDKLTGVEIRLLPPYIIDNKTKGFGIFKGYAKLYCLTIVVSDANNQLTGGIDLLGFPRIGDEEYLPINKSIFYWQQQENETKAPSQIHIMVTVMKSKKGLRDIGAIMSKMKSDADYKGILKQIADIGKSTSAVGVAIGLVTDVASIVGKYLTEVEDKPLGTIINSYTALSGDFAKQSVNHRTYKTRNVNFDINIIVRNAELSAEKTFRTTRVPKKALKKTRRSVPDDGWSETVVVDLEPIN